MLAVGILLTTLSLSISMSCSHFLPLINTQIQWEWQPISWLNNSEDFILDWRGQSQTAKSECNIQYSNYLDKIKFVVLLLDKISEEWGAVDSLTEIRLDFDKCKYEIKSSRPISLPSPLTHIHMEIMQINDNLSILQKGVREAPNNYHLQGYFKNWWSQTLNSSRVCLGFCSWVFAIEIL